MITFALLCFVCHSSDTTLVHVDIQLYAVMSCSLSGSRPPSVCTRLGARYDYGTGQVQLCTLALARFG